MAPRIFSIAVPRPPPWRVLFFFRPVGDFSLPKILISLGDVSCWADQGGLWNTSGFFVAVTVLSS
jgi:hypothetical protein